MDETERRKFNDWLSADEVHRATFDRELGLWQMLGGLADDLKDQSLADPSKINQSDERYSPTSDQQAATRSPPAASQRRMARAAIGIAASVVLALAYFAEDLRVLALADFSTGTGHISAVTLPDNTKVTLNTGSAISIDYAEHERRIRLLRGEVYFEVEPDNTRPFRVEALTGVSEAIGTAFAVRKKEDAVLVTVTEGNVSVKPDPETASRSLRRPHVVTAERQITYEAGTLKAPPQQVDVSSTIAWVEGKIVIERLSVSEAIAELDRYFPGRIFVIGSARNAPLVDGIFDTQDIETAVRAVAAVQGLSVMRTPGSRVLLLY